LGSFVTSEEDEGLSFRKIQLPVSAAATSGVNFTNILSAAFLYESFLCSFYILTIWFHNFLAQGFGTKAAHKMLVKLTPSAAWLPYSF
jgi:hypothetical protein